MCRLNLAIHPKQRIAAARWSGISCPTRDPSHRTQRCGCCLPGGLSGLPSPSPPSSCQRQCCLPALFAAAQSTALPRPRLVAASMVSGASMLEIVSAGLRVLASHRCKSLNKAQKSVATLASGLHGGTVSKRSICACFYSAVRRTLHLRHELDGLETSTKLLSHTVVTVQ